MINEKVLLGFLRRESECLKKHDKEEIAFEVDHIITVVEGMAEIIVDEIIERLEAQRDKAEAEFNATEHPYWVARYGQRKWAFEKAIEIVKECSMDKELRYNGSGYYDPTAYKALREVQKGEKEDESDGICHVCNGTENILPERKPDTE